MRTIILVFLLTAASGCREPIDKEATNASTIPNLVRTSLDAYHPLSIGDAIDGEPWVTHVRAADLDNDNLLDVIFCEGLKNEVNWLRQQPDGSFHETCLSSTIKGPVRTEVIDFDNDGDLDVIVSSMGIVFPNNEKIGSIVLLENNGENSFSPRILLQNVARVCDARPADLDDDGLLDIAAAQFGYDQGEARWMRNKGNGKFENHTLLSLSGSIHSCIGDMDNDTDLDIVILVSQEWEEIHLFTNDGKGGFEQSIIYGSTNEDFGSSGIQLVDIDQDGWLDVLYSNGDGFDIAKPGPRPWHGVQWLQNGKKGNYSYRRVADFPGAYSPIAEDFDKDGDIDIIAVGAFADWSRPESASLMLFENQGGEQFTPLRLAVTPTHLLSVDSGDFDGDGTLELVTGGFHAYPPFDNMSRITLWKSKQ